MDEAIHVWGLVLYRKSPYHPLNFAINLSCSKTLKPLPKKKAVREGFSEEATFEGVFHSRTMVLKPSVHQNHLEDLLKQVAGQAVWSGAQEFAFLTRRKMMLMLLVQELYLENH